MPQICSSCRGALTGLRRLRYALIAGGVLSLVCGSLGDTLTVRLAFAVTALASLALAAFVYKKLEQELIFKDYVHARID
jgi:hypothetical protein